MTTVKQPAELSLLAEPYLLAEPHVAEYRETGAVRLPGVLDADTLDGVRGTIRSLTREHDYQTDPLEERDTYGRAFTQVFNLWMRDPVARALAHAPRLARIATELMGCDGVRMYHDQALFKEAGGGHTPWHCDQFYWPVDTSNTITVWIPLQDTPLEMGPLAFAKGSHHMTSGRELQISDESERVLGELLSDYEDDEQPFALGDVSFHSGWTFHHARANTTDTPREAFTVIYIDKDARLREPSTPHEQFDAQMWCSGVEPGNVIDSDINPILFERE